jgi:hypothetical protein
MRFAFPACVVSEVRSHVSVFHKGGGRPERVSTSAESVKARSSERSTADRQYTPSYLPREGA